ncbi:hypothetical protein PC118_g25793 [Phytophthora cactorum]|uniref:Uncharacterized protein n=1 Tax=Phytophthora cactorum TaxID=29920 RepID=A0A8T1DU53_9STRA|nr:hypothetical protein PC118_g25793 [Phytophthora cactorum]
MLMRTHAGSVKKQENARFVADLSTAALGTEEYGADEQDCHRDRQCASSQ